MSREMALHPDQSELLEQLISQEEMISRLYEIFSKQFPQHASFWKELSLAEVRHAKLLKQLQEAVKKEQVIFDSGNITTKTLSFYLTRLEEVLQKAKAGEFTLQTALVCAVDYESSLVEKKIFSLFDSPHTKTIEVLNILQSETEEHVEFIKNIQRAVSEDSD